jgi:hypothetical protein
MPCRFAVDFSALPLCRAKPNTVTQLCCGAAVSNLHNDEAYCHVVITYFLPVPFVSSALKILFIILLTWLILLGGC